MINSRKRWMRVAPLTTRERQYVDQLIAENGGRQSFRIRQCYRNAQRLIWSDAEKRLRYCESGYDAIPHAWVTIKGKVVDVTAAALDRFYKRTGRKPGEQYFRYFGVVIDRRTAKGNMLRKSEWTAALDLKADFLKLRAAQLKRERAEARAARAENAVLRQSGLVGVRCPTI
jgi:hypothetical protein